MGLQGVNKSAQRDGWEIEKKPSSCTVDIFKILYCRSYKSSGFLAINRAVYRHS